MSFLTLSDITVSYDHKHNILENLNLDIEEGKLVSLLGPSGCGKTTTLRVIAGYIDPTAGKFVLDGQEMTHVAVHKRGFGIVFQSYALFPHLTVADNVAFGLKMQKEDKAVIKQKVDEMLKVCDLEQLKDRYPKQLSGGQRQRVAIARALVVKPKLLLLDEPLSNLDAKLRLNMRVEIKRLQKKMGITTVFVTHDQEECFSISDKVAVMNRGIIEQYDKPETIYKYPETEFVARFIGFENFIPVDHKEGNIYRAQNGMEITVNRNNRTGHCMGTIRPDNILISSSREGQNALEGTIGVSTFLGQKYQYEVETALGTMLVNAPGDQAYEQGDRVWLWLQPDKFVLVEPEDRK